MNSAAEMEGKLDLHKWYKAENSYLEKCPGKENVEVLERMILTLRLLRSYIYGAPILDVSRSYTTTHHTR